ncbi:P-loop NTPase fold protein [Myxococcus llanfairpwllgwyngyllgogerychwyrndrobwllllantysiliogogogochensis]|nr:P-loop NTPase fold protein [Myxococcus llanfairpwllgwyngyllgogerychwyrndrobwllllantysiliogogogochensis]
MSSFHPEEAEDWKSQLQHGGMAEYGQAPPQPAPAPTPSSPLSWLDNDTQRTLYSPRYDADGRENEDLLDIDRDVDALSALIASRTMAPPLSIGVFGDWGSGKSFFMHHLRKRVEELAGRAVKSQRPQREVAFYKNIIQIEFNAWHYAEGNLWASLVEHIFRNLRKRQDEPEADIGKRRDDLLTRLAQREAELLKKQAEVTAKEAEVALAQQKVGELEQQKESKRVELEQALSEKRTLLELMPATLKLEEGVQKRATAWLAETGFSSLGRTAFDLRDALGNAQAELRQTGGFVASLLDTRSANKRLRPPAIILIVSLAVSLALPFVLDEFGKQDLAGLMAGLTTLTGLVGSVTLWLQRQTAWLRERREQNEKRLHEVEQAIETDLQNRLKPLDEAAQVAREQVASLAQAEEQQRASMAKAQDEVLQLKQAIAELSSARLLDKFIENRTGSDDYRKHLGLVALIRRDFEELSRLMEAVNRDEQTDPNVPAINRIVLYIDDLDRCSQDTVVKVLQAVHLLLAFPLFVVVVGVDSRWVARCLNHTFKDLLKMEDPNALPLDAMTPGATAYDYLEKIFQIPIWLRPVSSDHRSSMLRGLLARPSAEEHSQEATVLELKPRFVVDTPDTVDPMEEWDYKKGSPALMKVVWPTSAAPQAATSVHGKPKSSASSSHAQVASNEQEELNPPGLVISERELAFIDCLGPLLSPTPRVLKRFANTYRLIKACVPSAGQTEFMGEEQEGTSPSQMCLLLLALVTSKPQLAEEFFALLKRYEHDEELLTLQALDLPSNEPEHVISELFTWLRAMPPAIQSTPLTLVRKLVPWVTRFSFR